MTTFQISIMAITPAMASHKARHPSCNFSVFMAEVRSKLVLRNERHALSADYRMLFAGCHRLMGVVNAHQCTILVRRQCARDDGGGAIGVGLRRGWRRVSGEALVSSQGFLRRQLAA
jgi:hypothetical protein